MLIQTIKLNSLWVATFTFISDLIFFLLYLFAFCWCVLYKEAAVEKKQHFFEMYLSVDLLFCQLHTRNCMNVTSLN